MQKSDQSVIVISYNITDYLVNEDNMALSVVGNVGRSLLLLLISILLISCASNQAVDNVQSRIDSYQQELAENQEAQREIKSALVKLEIAGQASSEKAVALRKELSALEEMQVEQTNLIRKMEASVSSNAADIQTFKSSEDSRKKAVERLNKSYEKIEQRTSEKMQDLNNGEKVAEGDHSD